KVEKLQKVFLDNFCLDSPFQFESIAASKAIPTIFGRIFRSLFHATSCYFFFSILSKSSLCLRICSPSLSSSSSSFSSFCTDSGLMHSEFPLSASLTKTALLSRVREHSSKFFTLAGTVLVHEMLAILMPSPGNVT